MRRHLLVFAVVAMLALAGCAGNPVDTGDGAETFNDNGTETTNDDETETGDDETATPPTEHNSSDLTTGRNPNGTLEIHHIDVGQADATLIRTPSNETVLVDTGDWRQDGEGVIEYLEAHDVERIDHLVATHAHADHIGGHAAVIEHFETNGEGVGAAYDSGVAHTSQTYETYLDAVERHDVDLFEVREGDRLPLDGNVTMTVLNPPEDGGSDLHDNSVVLTLQFGQFQYLTTGDAESAVEGDIVEEWPEQIDANVYQAGHHGSSTSSSEAFVDAVSPEIAVVSSALDSQYGHPSEETLRRFVDHGLETYWTAVHGDVVVTTGGTNVSVAPEHDETTDPLELLDRRPTDDSDDRDSIPTDALAPDP